MNSKTKIAIWLLLPALLLIGAAVFWFAAMNHRRAGAPSATVARAKVWYACGMHPQVIQDHPGNCSICGMKLERVRDSAAPPTAPSGKGKILYYRSRMMPGETSRTPAKDSMGMAMAPVDENEAAGAGSAAIAVDPVTIQQMNIQTVEVTRGPLRRIIRTVGTIQYNETALADVTTKFKGWIEKLAVDATGQLVHRGEPMFSIYSPELYSAQVEFLLALNATASNDSDAAALRETALQKLKFYDISQTQIADLEKNRQPRRALEVLAPADGFVTEKNIVEGQMVDAGMTLYKLADLGLVWVYAQVYEQDMPYIQLGQEASVKLASLPDREFRGRVTYVYPNVDEKTRTARVRLEFENPGYFLKPGMFVSVQIASELAPSALLIPDSAILRSGEKNTVFVALPGNKFDPRSVALGREAEGDQYEVLSGLQAGERVVASGQFMLDSESQMREAIRKMREPAPEAEQSSMEISEAASARTNAVARAAMAASIAGSSEAPRSEALQYVCPMPAHISITYNHPGRCPICGMALVPVTAAELERLRPGGKILYYTCPMPEHSFIHSDKPGKCPICAMTLIPVMAPPERDERHRDLAPQQNAGALPLRGSRPTTNAQPKTTRE